ncbi:type I restriction endonuclease subunit R [Flavobacterium taihuense]|uniref:type I site-specific deoxyribonuclease n=1 Tax=Flavobacterium taihuense TaxID=2857508 RepID=A0ABS6XWN3_9FLAO|nr:type I restriction endonuclease [Flavobacterium taihuense]MBW4361080.1 DEAD/DEAH box helicase family protein [Flavobacterium taihuense]
MAFNEDSRVKIPAILHLIRLGYTYIPRNEQHRIEETNIFQDVFRESISRINPSIEENEINRLLDEITLQLDYDDLGRDFYKSLTATSGIKLIDFNNFNNNSFHVTTELTCKNGDEEFRPDITLLINGIPLVFIEVKKPNNKNGIIEERNRINDRFKNRKFKRFANITQLMIFSNNMNYEDGVIEPLQGAYYATSAYHDLNFNYFREEEFFNLNEILLPENEVLENLVLKDNHLTAIKYADEFATNKHYDTPTNRILTSLVNKERLAFILKFALAYVEEEKDGKSDLQKHIMRYPQLFATKAISRKLSEGITKGIIWHTQGSGKTALAYYNVKYLTDYYQKKNIIPKFYFIVDRIDLAVQASTEFSNRGLKVNKVNSRLDFMNDIKKVGAIHNHSGESEITVINIQKFTEDATVTINLDYDINIQRIYFLDEAHRSYNPKGNYLANLVNSDKSAIKIALTGTPLLKDVIKEYDSKILFGDYIHKYYYNMSIADGYTLRLIREEIDTTYKMQMQEILSQINVLEGGIKKAQVYSHPKYVEPLLDYIVKDLQHFKKQEYDNSLGGMVVCDSAEQAKELFRYFEDLYGIQETNVMNLAAEGKEPYGTKPSLKAALILHDINDKDIRKDLIAAFKKGDIDVLFVYNMLLTGFDAKRLKKLYLARVIKDHNLLQTLTRVNRPYKKYQYGYVVDFADISAAFDKTNRMYFDELQAELGDEMEHYSNLFKSKEEMNQEIAEIKENLFHFDIKNAENFRLQIDEIKDKKDLLAIIKALRNAKELKNIIRLGDHDDLLQKLDFYKLNQLLSVAQARLDNLNLIESIQNDSDTTNLLNTALEDIFFTFTKVSEEEMILADALKNDLRRTREALLHNFDPKDPRFISLREELERIFKKKNLDEVTQDDMRENRVLLNSIYDRITEMNRKNALLKAKYEQDEKYARVHKRLSENGSISAKESQLHEALMNVKEQTDEQVLNNKNVIGNEAYFKKQLMQIVINEFIKNQHIKLDFDTTQSINNLIVSEYMQQYNGYTL